MELQRFEVENDGFFNIFGISSYEKTDDFKISGKTIRSNLDLSAMAFYIYLHKEQKIEKMEMDFGISHGNYVSVMEKKQITIHKYKLKKFIDKII